MMDTNGHQLDEKLKIVAASFEYPDTPDLNISLPEARSHVLRPALGWIAAFILLLSLSLAVPTVRASVWERLSIGVVEILLGGPSDVGDLQPTQPTSLAALGDPVPLEEAQDGVEFPLLLPRYPSALGLPDMAFLQYVGGNIAILVWLDPASGEAALALHELGQGALVSKIAPPIIRRTSVDGNPALWTEGPYPLVSRDGSVQDLRLVPGHVLVWEAGGTTFRLESSLPLDEALKIAESLSPLE
jgi:hypothetical protein